jgi:hypothetical protein
MTNNRKAVEDISDRAENLGVELQQQLHKAGEALKEIDFDEATIPDAFQKAPKFISPRVHSWLDAAVSTYFVVLGIALARRRKKGAATAAFVNAGMVAGVSLLTDYEGTGKKPISFKMHGTLDAVQAITAALGPVLHGFADKPESALFYGQAANEVAVIASTDWDAGMRVKRRKKAA